jgi:hypothetical protein
MSVKKVTVGESRQRVVVVEANVQGKVQVCMGREGCLYRRQFQGPTCGMGLRMVKHPHKKAHVEHLKLIWTISESRRNDL